jgi:hypothetical protein
MLNVKYYEKKEIKNDERRGLKNHCSLQPQILEELYFQLFLQAQIMFF